MKLKSRLTIFSFLFAKGLTCAETAKRLGMSRQLFAMKCTGTRKFTDAEFRSLATILGAKIGEIAEKEPKK